MPHNLADDAAARRINAQPWDPLPGMVKRRCVDCHYWFATRDPAAERCADCRILRDRERRRLEARERDTVRLNNG